MPLIPNRSERLTQIRHLRTIKTIRLIVLVVVVVCCGLKVEGNGVRFKIDENSPFSVKKILESMGNHQVDSVYHERKTGIEDRDLLTLCLNEKRILITLDTDFSNAFLHPQGTFYGLILLRPETQGKKTFLKLFQEF